MTVDTAADPLAGLEKVDIFKIRESYRYRTKVPSTLTFWRLKKYIDGANAGNVQIAMTRGGYTMHNVVREDRQGDIEMQERCLYLPSKFQGPGFQEQPEAGLADTLAPTEEGVYLKRQQLVVFVRKFPGWVFTASSWQRAHKTFSRELGLKEQFDPSVFYTRNSGYHWIPEEERTHEVWLPQLIK